MPRSVVTLDSFKQHTHTPCCDDMAAEAAATDLNMVKLIGTVAAHVQHSKRVASMLYTINAVQEQLLACGDDDVRNLAQKCSTLWTLAVRRALLINLATSQAVFDFTWFAQCSDRMRVTLRWLKTRFNVHTTVTTPLYINGKRLSDMTSAEEQRERLEVDYHVQMMWGEHTIESPQQHVDVARLLDAGDKRELENASIGAKRCDASTCVATFKETFRLPPSCNELACGIIDDFIQLAKKK